MHNKTRNNPFFLIKPISPEKIIRPVNLYFMKRPLKSIGLRLILVNLTLILLFAYVYKFHIELLIKTRDSLFTSFQQSSYFNNRLSNLGDYKNANPVFIEEYRPNVYDAVPEIKKIATTRYNDEIQKAKDIVLSFSVNGGGGYEQNEEILTKIKTIQNKKGLCSDHSEVFVALAMVSGMTPREIFNNGQHCFAEFFSEQRQKWIFIDPQLALLARDENGNYMSTTEMQEYYFSGKKIDFEFFGTNEHPGYKQPPGEHPYYSNPKNFEVITLSMGNNVFTVDKFNKKYAWLPKPIRQFFGMLSNTVPTYTAYSKNPSFQRQYLIIKAAFITLFALVFLFNMASIFAMVGIITGKKIQIALARYFQHIPQIKTIPTTH